MEDIIRIPENARIEERVGDELVLIGEYVIGVITPICPNGCMRQTISVEKIESIHPLTPNQIDGFSPFIATERKVQQEILKRLEGRYNLYLKI